MTGFDPAKAIAAVLDENHEPVGYGFLIDYKWFVTCTHVFDEVRMKDETIRIEFPIAAQGKYKGTYFYPRLKKRTGISTGPGTGEIRDVAILEITENLPAGIGPVPLSKRKDHEFSGETGEIYGSSENDKDDRWVEVKASRQVSINRIQLNRKKTGDPVVLGFSGSMVWNKTENAAMGMVTDVKQVGKKEDDVKQSFMVPASQIRKIMEGVSDSDDPRLLLCHRVDRMEQVREIEVLAEKKGIVTCILHGDKNQCHGKFLRCLAGYYWRKQGNPAGQ